MEASNPTHSGAMTMGGVEQIARDVGIDTEYVRAAASQLEPRSTRDSAITPPKRNIIIGGPTRLVHERIVQGELAESDFPVLVDEIRMMMSEVGQVAQLGSSFTWTLSKGTSGTRNLEVAVTVRGGRTRIVVQENLGQLIGGIFGGVGGGMGGGGMGPILATLGASHMLSAAAFIVPAWFALTFSLARTSFHYAARRRDQKMAELVTHLADTVRQLVGGSAKLLPR
jgi:hypothetical protein